MKHETRLNRLVDATLLELSVARAAGPNGLQVEPEIADALRALVALKGAVETGEVVRAEIDSVVDSLGAMRNHATTFESAITIIDTAILAVAKLRGRLRAPF